MYRVAKWNKGNAMSKTKREKELESELRTASSCITHYHDEMIRVKKAFDIVFRECLSPSQLSDLLAELYELRQEREEKLGKETREWLDAFKELHHISSDNDAIIKLIEIHKAWNMKMGDEFEQWNKDRKKKKDS